jgi:methionine salvage enolase-phosphatase E1
LLPLVVGHFDIPAVGNKKQADSCRKIAAELGVDPASVVFVRDAEAELNDERLHALYATRKSMKDIWRITFASSTDAEGTTRQMMEKATLQRLLQQPLQFSKQH